MAQLLSTTITGNLATSGILTGGITGNVVLQSISFFGQQINGNANSFFQISTQNQNNGGSASADFVAHANDGSDTNYYVDVGINSSGYNDPAYTIMRAHDSYLYNAGGNLVIGTSNTGSANDLIFFANGTLSSNETARFYGANGNFKISNQLIIAGNVALSRSGTTLANIPQITVATTAHASPRVGDLWVDTN